MIYEGISPLSDGGMQEIRGGMEICVPVHGRTERLLLCFAYRGLLDFYSAVSLGCRTR